MTKLFSMSMSLVICSVLLTGCNREKQSDTTPSPTSTSNNTPEYFLLRPEVEKAYGYSHAVRIGDDLKISGAVSMDDKGILTAPGSMEQQMKNCYSDLEKILQHYGYTFDDVVVENVFTTNMQSFINVSVSEIPFTKNNFQQLPGWK